MKKLIHRLKEPFPIHKKPKKNFINLLGVGGFITLFLFLFRPFGLNQVPDNVFLICLSFGFVTILFGFSFDLFNTYILKIKTDIPSWTLGRWIIQSVFLLCWIAFGNALLLTILDSSTILNPNFVLNMIGNTVMIGIFPIIFSGLMTQMNAIKSNETEASTFIHNNIKECENIDLDLGDSEFINTNFIQFIEAQQNYISVNYTENNSLKSKLIRNTLSNVEEKLNRTSLIKCHRSYIVNMQSIKEVKGNAQGLKISLNNTKIEIPVSRKFITEFKKAFNNQL